MLRRDFVSGAVLLPLATALRAAAQTDGATRKSFANDPFTLGIASGDPTPTGVVLWTRLAPDPLAGGGMSPTPVNLLWEVAEDDQMRQVVKKGNAVATAPLGHSVHVEVDGLKPDRPYWYRFRAGDAETAIGRTRTTPRRNDSPQRMRFAVATCQHYEQGLYTAYQHMAERDLDLVIHLGDYIYEYEGKDNLVRKHNGMEIESLDDYRNRLSQYKSDPNLQAAHAAFPWAVTWDDHEFDNNYANLVSEERGVDPEAFMRRRANAYQAYYEHMPLRRRALPRGPDMRLYRPLSFGRLAEFCVLDTRQYRTDQPNGDGSRPRVGDVFDPQATLLGAEQEGWLMSRLIGSTATWNLLAQQIMMAAVDIGQENERLYHMDQWPAYEVARRRLLDFVADRKIPNPVVLTGDYHKNWANDVRAEVERPEAPVVATEFVTTSISSGGDGGQATAEAEFIMGRNPGVHFYNNERGYVEMTLTPDRLQSDYQVVEYVSRPGAPLVTRASFVVEAGRAGMQRA